MIRCLATRSKIGYSTGAAGPASGPAVARWTPANWVTARFPTVAWSASTEAASGLARTAEAGAGPRPGGGRSGPTGRADRGDDSNAVTARPVRSLSAQTLQRRYARPTSDITPS